MSRTIPKLHLVTLRCKSARHAEDCLAALNAYGRPDAMAYGCKSYEFGRVLGDETTVLLAERWEDWGSLDRLLTEKVVPALPTYNALLERDFDPARDTRRISLA